MKLSLSVCFLSLFLTACSGFDSSNNTPADVDPAFDTILLKYRNDKLNYLGTSSTKNITILFYTQASPVIGECITGGDTRTILIDPAYWFYSSFNDQITLFYHEMGHCDLNIHEHATTPTIMNEYALSGSVFATDPNFYLHELFVNRR